MKKLTMKAFDLGVALSRAQMKEITGAHSIGGPTTCNEPNCGPTQLLCIVLDGSCNTGCGYYCSPVCPVYPICPD